MNRKSETLLAIRLASVVLDSGDATPKETLTSALFAASAVMETILRDKEASREKALTIWKATEGLFLDAMKKHNLLLESGSVRGLLDWADAGCPPRHNARVAEEIKREIEGSV